MPVARFFGDEDVETCCSAVPAKGEHVESFRSTAFWRAELEGLLTARAEIVKSGSGMGLSLMSAVNGLKSVLKSVMSDLPKAEVHKRLKEDPPFRLDQYEQFTSAVIDKCADAYADRGMRAARATNVLARELVSVHSKHFNFTINFQLARTSINVSNGLPTLVDSVIAAILAEDFSTESLAEAISLRTIPIGKETASAVARRAELEGEIAKTRQARDGICEALESFGHPPVT